MENSEQKIYVAQKAILIDDDGKILTMRRTATASSWPLSWDIPGGKLEFGESLQGAIAREIREETGLEVKRLELLDVAAGFDDKRRFWVTICYIVKPITTDVVLSHEHDEFKWVTPDEFQKINASSKNKQFVEKFEELQK